MVDKKTLQILATPQTKLPIEAKFVIAIPNKVGTSEFENCVDMLGEIKRDNPDYVITICDECEECGAINDTVQEVEIEGYTNPTAFLCDYCYGRREQ